MASITINDTHKLITVLQERGFTKEQAEGLIEAAKNIDVSSFATETRQRALEIKMNFVLGLLVAVFAGVFVLLLSILPPLAQTAA